MTNYVTTGAYAGSMVCNTVKGQLYIKYIPKIFKTEKIFLNTETVADFEIIGEEVRASATSAVTRGAIGVALLGPVGVAAALSARKKGNYTIGIVWADGQKSIIELNNANYKFFKSIFINQLF